MGLYFSCTRLDVQEDHSKHWYTTVFPCPLAYLHLFDVVYRFFSGLALCSPLYLFSQCSPQTLKPETRNKPCSSLLSGIYLSSGLFHPCFNNSAPPNLHKSQNSSLLSLLLVYFELCFTWIYLSLSSRLLGSMQYLSQSPLKQSSLDQGADHWSLTVWCFHLFSFP